MVQCNKCKMFVSMSKDDIVRCKGPCEGVFHRKCAKGIKQDLCETCTRAEANPVPSPRIEMEPSKLTVENLLQQVNKKLEVVFKIETKLAELTTIVDFYSQQYQQLMEFKESAEKKITAIERKNIYLEKYTKSLEERLLDLEQKEKERNVEIIGLESLANENLPKVMATIATKLNLDSSDVEEVKRVGAIKPIKPGEKPPGPRPVVVTLRTKTARDQWLSKRKTRLTNGCVYQNDSNKTIYINEDLSKYKRQLFWSAKNQLKTSFAYIWVQNSSILVKRSEDEKKIYNIRSEADIQSLIDMPVSPPPPLITTETTDALAQ